MTETIVICPRCLGKAELKHHILFWHWKTTCKVCKGSGCVKAKECPACRGGGIFDCQPCPDCKGSGSLPDV